MQAYTHLAIGSPDALIYGVAPRPVTTRSGLVIGGGTVYPELNFTLPPMTIEQETLPEVRAQYAQMIDEACKRAVELAVPGLVVEFELLPPQTMNPDWGAEVTAVLRDTLDRYAARDGLISALRVTPNDIREHRRPPRMRDGELWEAMLQSFERNLAAGADMVSIESTGGKEVHDEAIVNADLRAVALSLGVLGCRDMQHLWNAIGQICTAHHAIAAGDSACGFGNTAMVLAEKQYIPRVWAAIIRVMTVPRALVAHSCGAVGPGKDCAYENAYLKAITGCPMSAEGADAACAHLSPVGNIAHTTADLWSNESVQNIKLLGGMAPTVSLEQLAYTTRLMNCASQAGPTGARTLRDWYTQSDASYDPQAWVLHPDVVIDIARQIVAEPDPWKQTRRAAIAATQAIQAAVDSGALIIPAREVSWLSRMTDEAEDLPETEQAAIEEILPEIDTTKVLLEQYGI